MLRIVTDTREQAPYMFAGYDAEVTRGVLSAGDYSIAGFTDLVAVERKELSDLLGCLTHDRPRFIREMERLRGYHAAALLVESSFKTIQRGNYKSRMEPTAAVQSIFSIMANYRMPIFFAENRTAGEHFTFNFLRHFASHAEQRYKAITATSKGDRPK